jgi:hypothetical protein
MQVDADDSGAYRVDAKIHGIGGVRVADAGPQHVSAIATHVNPVRHT